MSGADEEDWSWFGPPGEGPRAEEKAGLAPAAGSLSLGTESAGDRFDTAGWGGSANAALHGCGPAGTASAATFGGPHAQTGSTNRVAASAVLLYAGLSSAVVAIGLGLLAPRHPLVSVSGWLLGGFFAVGMVTAHSYWETRAQADPRHLPDPSRAVVRWATFTVCLAAVVLHAWAFATWLARQGPLT
jgi:hypothetical protein